MVLCSGSCEYLQVTSPCTRITLTTPDGEVVTMDPHALTAPFQFTKTMRRELYPAINPENPELSARGKTILITGATGGIGGVRYGCRN